MIEHTAAGAWDVPAQRRAGRINHAANANPVDIIERYRSPLPAALVGLNVTPAHDRRRLPADFVKVLRLADCPHPMPCQLTAGGPPPQMRENWHTPQSLLETIAGKAADQHSRQSDLLQRFLSDQTPQTGARTRNLAATRSATLLGGSATPLRGPGRLVRAPTPGSAHDHR